MIIDKTNSTYLDRIKSFFIFNNLLHIYMTETHKKNVQRIDKGKVSLSKMFNASSTLLCYIEAKSLKTRI